MTNQKSILKTALIGASGNVGSRILAELLDRGHEVTAIVRRPENLWLRDGLSVKRGDVSDEIGLPQLLYGHDAVISALRFGSTDPQALLRAVKRAGVKRLLTVGGAGTLEVAPGVQFLDTPEFPAAYKPDALAGRYFLSVLRGELQLHWTFLSPSASLEPGERTGEFRLGKDQLLVNAAGESRISIEDYAVALVDELERPRHNRQRFTVGY
ncbi:MAG: uncharacterized protein QOE70_270 [Chthoniobacter sp.]|jgi:putative NADH-flavin reductase|nr:uncharacterized protein [Chthoniobacter sp.]